MCFDLSDSHKGTAATEGPPHEGEGNRAEQKNATAEAQRVDTIGSWALQ